MGSSDFGAGAFEFFDDLATDFAFVVVQSDDIILVPRQNLWVNKHLNL